MGWFGHGNYDGDETQTWHYDFLKWAKISKNYEELFEWTVNNKTIVPDEFIPTLKKNLPLILKKMTKFPKNPHYVNEHVAVEWQMLMALYTDNKIALPKNVLKTCVEASEYLCGNDHAPDFNNPSARRRAIRNLVEKAEKTVTRPMPKKKALAKKKVVPKWAVARFQSKGSTPEIFSVGKHEGKDNWFMLSNHTDTLVMTRSEFNRDFKPARKDDLLFWKEYFEVWSDFYNEL